MRPSGGAFRDEPVRLVQPADASLVEQIGEKLLRAVCERNVRDACHAPTVSESGGPRSDLSAAIPWEIPWRLAAAVYTISGVGSDASATTPARPTGTALVEEMLELAYEFVREGWCQGAAARDAAGRPVSPASAFASRWSAAGALERAWARHEDPYGVALDAFERANLALAAATGDVPQAWNDAAGRTLHDVLDALAEAIQLAVGPPRPNYVAPKVDSASG
jgi:hypothetical protein